MFAPLRLGPVAIEFPAVQAALAGYTDGPMRRIARRLGAPYTLCEVLLDQFVVNVTKGPKVRRFLHVPEEDHPCGAQLMGDSPEQFALAAAKLATVGFDVIDLNFACPVKKVLGAAAAAICSASRPWPWKSSPGCATPCRRRSP